MKLLHVGLVLRDFCDFFSPIPRQLICWKGFFFPFFFFQIVCVRGGGQRVEEGGRGGGKMKDKRQFVHQACKFKGPVGI